MDDIFNYINERFEQGASTVTRQCATGEDVITFSCGVKEECQYPEAVATNERKAKEMFLAEFDKYAAGQKGKIYWRCKPMMNVESFELPDGRSLKIYYVRARFLISYKPTIGR